MICRAIPYEGNEPYVFLSYCHKDAAVVYPLLEQMVSDGYRVWYDDGNHAGDDWLENIALHLDGCAVCLAIISENAASSHNCRNEINFAIECNKKLLALLLEDFCMPKGMRLQLGTIHYLKKYEFPSPNSLLLKLYETSALDECKAVPGSLPMRDIEDILPHADSNPPKKKKIIADLDDTDLSVDEPPSDTGDDSQADHPCTDESISDDEQVDDDELEVTVYDNPPLPEDEDSDAPTERAEKEGIAVLLRPSTGAAYVLDSVLSRIGRSKKRCDVVLDSNAYIGNCHAEIIQYKGQYYLRDLGSTNGTYINGEKLGEGEKSTLSNLCCFKLYDEPFLFVCGATANQIISGEIIYFLHSKATQGVKLLYNGDLLLDRSHKWEDGTLNDPKISRKNKHAVVKYDGDKLLLEDLGSRNGTYLNGLDIRGKGMQGIQVNDQIRLGDTTLIVGIITLQGDKE